ncbi:MAG TPA: RNA polymerase sigma factor region1.1 domain-containing protein, partial [Roseateles sp.]
MTAKKTATKASPAPAEELKKKPAAKAAAAKPAAKTAKAAATEEDKPKRGRKPKAETTSKKAAGKKDAEEEEDFSDIDADVEGEGEEVEAEETTAVAEETVKAKPLRMKVSRAKERALMREFGLEETALTEEEALKRRTELKTLIKMGKTRGFLTHQEINDHLPEKLVSEEILEAIVSMLNDMGIAVYEQAPDAATLLIQGNTTATSTEEEAEEAAEAALSTVDSEFGRTTDPVRM